MNNSIIIFLTRFVSPTLRMSKFKIINKRDLENFKALA
jgi:hypothetical protein